MDEIFVTGVGVTIAAVLVFCGSVWLLLTVVLGARLAYFVTASITLAFILMMGVVWSFTNAASPLGPVGELPSFSEEALGEGGDLDFGAAGSFPNEPWRVPDEDDEAESTQKAEAETAATEAVGEAISAGDITAIEAPDDATAVSDSTRLLEQDGVTYAGVIVQPAETGGGGDQQEPDIDPESEGNVLVVLQYDAGNPLGTARTITLGVLIVLGAHLFGLSRSERKAREPAETPA
jgi:hypothetical protein